ATLLALRPDEAVALTATYLKAGFDRAPLVETLASAAAKVGHDPHNQELGLCLLEEYLRSTAADRERPLLASAQHTAGDRQGGGPCDSEAQIWRIRSHGHRRYTAPVAAFTMLHSSG